MNGADGISDIEGKVARVSDEGDGKRPSFKFVVELLDERSARRGRRDQHARRARSPEHLGSCSFVTIRGYLILSDALYQFHSHVLPSSGEKA